MDNPAFVHAREKRRRYQNYQGTTLVGQRPPDIVGQSVRAWRVDLADPVGRDAKWGATIALWLLHAPNVHPNWEYFVLIVNHLRGVEGLPDPHKTTPDAEYEFAVLSLNPQQPLPNLKELEKGADCSHGQIHAMEPADFVSQVGNMGNTTSVAIYAGDARAYEVAEKMVYLLVSGALIPDADYRVQWAQALVQVIRELPQTTVN
jgi:hypothetical protein